MEQKQANIPENEAIQPMTLDDLDDLVELHGEYLNYGEGVRPHCEAVLKQEGSIALKYVIDGSIAGLIMFTEGIDLSGGHPELVQKAAAMAKGRPVYTGDAVLVRIRYRRRHIARALMDRARAEMRRRGAAFVLLELWVLPDGKVPAAPLVETFSWAYYLGKHKNFYEDFYHYGYACPICGESCVCSAQLYLCSLEEEDAP